MAVPSSGTLTMLGIARERYYGNYVSTGIIPYPILMTDLINGGGLNNFPALNTNCVPRPNTSTPHSMNEWYGYRQICIAPVECKPIELRFTSRYKSGADACVAPLLVVFSADPSNPKWFTVPLYGDEGCEEGVWAASGAYSDGNNWGVWDGVSGNWTAQGICEF